MKYQYLIIKSDEDGNPNYFIASKDELNIILGNLGDELGRSPDDIMDDFPESLDANYWGENVLILEIKGIVAPKVKLSV